MSTPTATQPSQPASAAFQTLTLSQVQSDLIDLYRRVACTQGRVEIAADERGECDCVLISKAELDSLERALNILADSRAVRELSGHLADLAELVEPEHAGV
jgi:PHD/YefM family antitoxin component YafN of YafNO toxin-antitoxin module